MFDSIILVDKFTSMCFLCLWFCDSDFIWFYHSYVDGMQIYFHVGDRANPKLKKQHILISNDEKGTLFGAKCRQQSSTPIADHQKYIMHINWQIFQTGCLRYLLAGITANAPVRFRLSGPQRPKQWNGERSKWRGRPTGLQGWLDVWSSPDKPTNISREDLSGRSTTRLF